MNTKIEYLYRDVSNYKSYNTAIIPGEITPSQIRRILDSLGSGEYFVPKDVGLPEVRFDDYNPQDDVDFFELSEHGISRTAEYPTVTISPEDLTKKFEEHSYKWKTMGL